MVWSIKMGGRGGGARKIEERRRVDTGTVSVILLDNVLLFTWVSLSVTIQMDWDCEVPTCRVSPSGLWLFEPDGLVELVEPLMRGNILVVINLNELLVLRIVVCKSIIIFKEFIIII